MRVRIWSSLVKKQFVLALSFLTVFPGSSPPEEQGETAALAQSAPFYPVVGAILGLILVAADCLCSSFSFATRSVIVLATLAVLTGGLHLDGFADTVDGLGALLKHGREKALAVMRDTGAGPLAVAGLVLLVLFKFTLLEALWEPLRPGAIFLFPVAGRWILVLGGRFPYARASGLGKGFAGQIALREVYAATLGMAFIFAIGAAVGVWFLGLTAVDLIRAGALGFGTALLGGLIFIVVISRWLGGMTGDTLGAANELAEALFLLGWVLAGN